MEIMVMNRRDARKYSYMVQRPCAIISIHTPWDGPNWFAKNPYIKKIHTMSFYDITHDEKDIKAPCREDFKGLKEFVDNIKDKVELLIVHCDAGRSRSAATAMAIEDYLGMESTIRGNSKYCPNYTVYDNVMLELGIDKTQIFSFEEV